MSIRIRFDAKLTTKSDKGVFPKDTITAVYVTNRDGCSYQCAPVDAKGKLKVDFVMKPLESEAYMTDRVKFHFYFRDNSDQMLKPVCAGHMALLDLADHVGSGGAVEIRSNFTTNRVLMHIEADAESGRDMHLELLKLHKTQNLRRSVLLDSEKILASCKTLDKSVSTGLDHHTVVSSDNGGHMFASVFTAHMMQDECTLYPLYHLDFDEPHHVPSFLATYMLAQTLHHNALTIEQVKALPLKGLTDFVASYAQAPMRSASAVPYTLDMTLNEDPKQYFMRRTQLSEIFKRPYSHPHAVLQGRGTLQTDDCEGLVVTIQNLTNHLGYMYDTHLETFRQTDSYLAYNQLKKRYFPNDLFAGMSTQYQNRLMDLAFFLGEHISKKVIECKVTLVTANGASMSGTGEKEVQAHACASMVCNDPHSHHVVMMEGTACATDDQDSRRIKVGGQYVTLAEVANSITSTPPFNQFAGQGFKTKVAMHLTHSHGSFYRTAFCQNDSMLGSQIGQGRLTYGVDMEYLADESVKVYMPVMGKDLAQGEYARLKQYVQDRRAEIHPPLVDHDELRTSLKWHPIGPSRGCKELQANRPYTTCLVHVLTDESNPVDALLARMNTEVEQFNSNPELSKIGVMRAFPSMDGVSKVLHLYTDDTQPLLDVLVTKQTTG